MCLVARETVLAHYVLATIMSMYNVCLYDTNLHSTHTYIYIHVRTYMYNEYCMAIYSNNIDIHTHVHLSYMQYLSIIEAFY